GYYGASHAVGRNKSHNRRLRIMECPHIPEISYTQFGERLYDEVVAKRIPLSGSLELTFRCNLRCAHCYCNLSANDRDIIEKELTTEEVFNILDQIAEAGHGWRMAIQRPLLNISAG
ncbi:MAG: hypothetical protein Q7J27_12885, partial [Syntrophales bacterium]|nr:hypothetical protein [Syntrophales bacterium]